MKYTHKNLDVSKVTLDGEDVTLRCFEADDELGYVKLYRVKDKSFYLNEDKRVAWEMRKGKVVVKVSKK